MLPYPHPRREAGCRSNNNLNCCKNCTQNAARQTFTHLIYFSPKYFSAEFQDRLNKIDKLRCRYEILTVIMMPPEGEEEKTQAYYVIKVFYYVCV